MIFIKHRTESVKRSKKKKQNIKTMNNPWHTVSMGDHTPEIVNGIVEIPKGSRAKYELHKESGMRMLDNGEADDKIIAVAANDMSVNYINDISELPPHTIKETPSFFENYKKLEKKEVVIEDFMDRYVAYQIINQSIVDYDKKFRK